MSEVERLAALVDDVLLYVSDLSGGNIERSEDEYDRVRLRVARRVLDYMGEDLAILEHEKRELVEKMLERLSSIPRGTGSM